jgi:SAM-dependent methyltransferase
MRGVAHSDFEPVTEMPGDLVSAQAIDMAATRYRFAAELSAGRRVLEVACGPGVGLSVLSARAGLVVAGDSSESALRRARLRYGGRVPLIRFDAQALPFGDGSFDVVVMYEALYFIPDARSALSSMCRVLAPGGQLVIGSVNPARPGFIPAPGATTYHRASQLVPFLEDYGLRAEVFGAFPIEINGAKERVLIAARRVAAAAHLIPRSMKGKQLIKRLIFGKLIPFPHELNPLTLAYVPPTPLAAPPAADEFIVYYIVASKPTSEER